MKLIIGLGNPGKEYESTRHNLGFRALDRLAQSLNLPSSPADYFWKHDKKYNAEMIERRYNDEVIQLIKPQTFMNNSGDSVGSLVRFYKPPLSDVWVIHDDLDLPLSALRMKQGGSAGGHKGVQSVIDAIGSDFMRFRIGIGHEPKPIFVESFVLGKFGLFENMKINAALQNVEQAVKTALLEGFTMASTLYSS